MRHNYVIITDENGKPMSWSKDSLCYATDEHWEDKPFPVQVYTEARARKFIERNERFEKKNNITTPLRAKLIPAKLPARYRTYNR